MLGKRYTSTVEEKWKQEWENFNVYAFDQNSNKPMYTIDTPPPFTSGKLHMGHVLSYSYFDFVARYKRMQGYNVYYPQGWDCQGFPTEVKVEKKHKIRGKDDPEKFIKLSREWTLEMIRNMKQQMNVLGFSADWNYEYRTIDDSYHEAVQYSLLKMYEKDEVYNAEHPVYWCTDCLSAIAKAETNELERETELHHIKFPTDSRGGYVPIATSRPELLHACVAVVVNPLDAKYRLLVNSEIQTPLGKKVKIIKDDDVDREFGSGAVMVCTYGDKQDVVWVNRHNLDRVRAMGDKGELINAGEFNGMKVKEARQAVIEKLKQDGNYIKSEKIKQVVKVHDRCKHPVELLDSKQWFIKVKDKKDDIIGTAKKIKWCPEFGISYLINWANFIEWDWVISRNRTLGTPIPFWYCEKCDKWYPAKYDELPVDPRIMSKKCPECGNQLKGEQTVLDCWVDSSISPLYIAGWPHKFNKTMYPVDLRPQGVEIVRTWAYYTIARCLSLTGEKPFKEILLNGNVLAPDNKKMSKSLGNVIDPSDLLKEFSVDAIRQWSAMSGAMAKDRAFNRQDIIFAKSYLTKLWNTAKFIESHIQDYEYDDSDLENLRVVDQWILSRLYNLIPEVTEAMDKYEFHRAIKAIHDFTWHELCDYYLEFVKYRLYGEDEKSKDGARYTLFNVLLTLSKLMAPFTPHISEEIYQVFYPETDNFVVKSEWPLPNSEWYVPMSLTKGDYLKQAMDVIREWKAKNSLSMKAEVPKITIKVGKNALGKSISIDDILDDIKNTGHVQEIIIEKIDGQGISIMV